MLQNDCGASSGCFSVNVITTHTALSSSQDDPVLHSMLTVFLVLFMTLYVWDYQNRYKRPFLSWRKSIIWHTVIRFSLCPFVQFMWNPLSNLLNLWHISQAWLWMAWRVTFIYFVITCCVCPIILWNVETNV